MPVRPLGRMPRPRLRQVQASPSGASGLPLPAGAREPVSAAQPGPTTPTGHGHALPLPPAAPPPAWSTPGAAAGHCLTLCPALPAHRSGRPHQPGCGAERGRRGARPAAVLALFAAAAARWCPRCEDGHAPPRRSRRLPPCSLSLSSVCFWVVFLPRPPLSPFWLVTPDSDPHGPWCCPLRSRGHARRGPPASSVPVSWPLPICRGCTRCSFKGSP